MNKITKTIAITAVFIALSVAAKAQDTCPMNIWESTTTGWMCLLDTEQWVFELPSCYKWEVTSGDHSQLWVCRGDVS
jgi:hypothetical protein